MALVRFFSCDRSSWQLTTTPVGIWVIRTADFVVLTLWPPAPDEQKVSIRRSMGSMCTSTSSTSGMTATVTVAVMPEVDEVDVHIDPMDLRIDTFCSSGAGGQSVNTTKSAVRITHIPTGVVVSCQDERSQLKNRNKAMRTLRARIVEAERERQEAEIAQSRKAQVGTGERSEKIRTYNFPQNRVTDHRVGVTLHKLEQVLEGDLGELVQALKAQRQQEVGAS